MANPVASMANRRKISICGLAEFINLVSSKSRSPQCEFFVQPTCIPSFFEA